MGDSVTKVEHSIECQVSLGMFSDERAISIALPDGDSVTALVDERHVMTERKPEPGEAISGRVKVFIVSENGETVLLDLPQASFSNGARIEVSRNILR